MSRIVRIPGRTPGARVAALLAVAALGIGGLGAASSARADEQPEDMVKLAVRFEPPSVAPGGQGVAVVTATLSKGLHVSSDDKLFVVALKAVPGVTYGAVTKVTPPVAWKDPEFPEEPPQNVWFHGFEFRIAFTLAEDAPAGVEVGAVVQWNGCSSETGQCYNKVKVPFGAAVPRPAVANGGPVAAPPAQAPGAPPVPAAPAAPVGCKAPKDAVLLDSDSATVKVWITEGKVKFCFTPKSKEIHLYSPEAVQDDPILVEGIASEGIAWSPMEFPPSEHEIKAPVEVSVPYATQSATPLKAKIKVHWQGCTETECLGPENRTLDVELTKDGGKVIPPAPPAPAIPPPAPVVASTEPSSPGTGVSTAPPVPAGTAEKGILFPVVGDQKEKSWIQQNWEKLGIWVLGLVFLVGLGLAFTPCVLPLIPITVSIIGGGKSDISKSRMTVLLSAYVAGLAMAFGSLGLVAALSGSSISAAFESPAAMWVIASIFTVLALGMFGIYELQPPQFLQRLQGGAKGGSIVGSFVFGALGAVIASPCTGPVIVGMLVFTAQGGNALVGFLMFVTLGLGMGSVLFVAGSLNMIMRPGPWMVWVRYGFGVMLVGVALYYLASSGHLSPTGVFVGGFAIALLVAAGITRHLMKGEGESLQPAMSRGAKAAMAVILATGLVAWITRPVVPAGGNLVMAGADEGWISLRDRAHMVAEVEKSKASGRASVVDVWATWCHFCRVYDDVIEADPELKAGFETMGRLRVDVTEDQRKDLRDGVGIEAGQPRLVFIDKEGRIRRDMDLFGMEGGKDVAKENLKKRLRELGVLGTKVATARK